MKKIFFLIFILMSATVIAGATEQTMQLNSGWNMASFWFSTSTLIGELSGAGIDAYGYDKSGNSYYKMGDGDTVEMGKSYWIKASIGSAFTVDGDSFSPGSPYSGVLTTGWNLLGNPFSERVPIDNISINSTAYSEYINATSSQPILTYGAGMFVESDEYLEKGEGFWLYADATGSISIQSPPASLQANAGSDAKCIISIYHTYEWTGEEYIHTPHDETCKLFGGATGGSGSYSYSWAQIAGTTVTFDDPSSSTPTFTPVDEGIIVFRLTVSDGQSVDTDTVAIQAVRLTGKIVFIAFLGAPNETGVFSMNADGTGFFEIISDTAFNFWPSWSLDGTMVAFSSDRAATVDQPNNREVYTINADGTNLTRLTDAPGYDALPEWSTDGEKILFTSDRTGLWQIYSMKKDGTAQERLTYETYKSFASSYSPGGNKIAFTQEIGYDNYEVMVMDSNGANVQRLTNDSLTHVNYAWTMNGDILYSQATCIGCDAELYIMTDSGTNNTKMYLYPSVSKINGGFLLNPTSEYLFYQGNDGYIHVMCSDGTCDSRIGHMGSSPDYYSGP